MVITVKAKKPGLWHVYKSEGLVLNRPAGTVRRAEGQASAYYFYADGSHDIDPLVKWSVSSNPREWPNTIKNIIRNMERPKTPRDRREWVTSFPQLSPLASGTIGGTDTPI